MHRDALSLDALREHAWRAMEPHYRTRLAALVGGDAVDDVRDDMAELVLHHRGQIVILPNEQMPSRTGIAAIYLL